MKPRPSKISSDSIINGSLSPTVAFCFHKKMAFSFSGKGFIIISLAYSVSYCWGFFYLSQERIKGRRMGRAKLEIKYRQNARARLSIHMTRMKGLKKKARELSLLCGVDVLLASFSPKLNTAQFWPEQGTLEFRRIREQYLRFRRSEKKSSDCNCTVDEGNYGNINQHTPCLLPPMPPSPSFSSSFLEELSAMDLKLKEVRARISFLQASYSSSSDENLVQIPSSSSDEDQRLQVTVPHSLPLQDEPSPFAQSLPSLADFTMEDPPTSLPPDSPLWSSMDDLNWCDSLVNYDYSNINNGLSNDHISHFAVMRGDLNDMIASTLWKF